MKQKHIKKLEYIKYKIKKKNEKPFFKPIITSKDEIDKLEEIELKKKRKCKKQLV